KVTNDCIAIPKSCPEDKPLFDANLGECVSLDDKKCPEGMHEVETVESGFLSTTKTKECVADFTFPWIAVLIAGIGILIATVLIVYRLRKR
ncbi:MAG: hypothetical protein AABY22_07995, partial [Nanoarchaeota archaeon]